jgi:hypothetical protein
VTEPETDPYGRCVGFLKPNLPDLDLATWQRGSRQDRMRPLVRHFGEVGFGSPDVVTLVYVVKIAVYVLVGWLFILTTPGIDGFIAVSDWWRDPIVFYKAVVWTMLFEVLGLGCGFGPLNLRFTPPLGSFLYWLRPGTIRLAPWPGRVPLTGGDSRTVVDVVLYAALVVSLTYAVLGELPRWQVYVALGLLAAIGLRDKTIFLAARSEVYATLAVTYLFVSGDQVVAAKLVMVAIWWGAAASKLNRHFPYVVAAMMSNSPVWRRKEIKRKFHRDFPDDLRPSRISAFLAHAGTAVEFGAPLFLLLGDGGIVTKVAAVVMICFHLNIISSVPMGVPLEWNVFMILGILTLFVAQAGAHPNDLVHPLPVIALMAVVVGTVVLGNLFPGKVSFLPAMRYYAGNWDTSLWCFRGAAIDKMDANLVKASLMPHQQLEKIYGAEQVALTMHLGYAFRACHTHGRALFTLVPRACGAGHEEYFVIDGEMVAGTALGWNFGDGHLHDEQLIDALQKRCHFEPGEVRVVILEAQPFTLPFRGGGTQAYRLVDAATGEIERGYVEVKDLVSRQPTDHDVPVHVTSAAPASA